MIRKHCQIIFHNMTIHFRTFFNQVLRPWLLVNIKVSYYVYSDFSKNVNDNNNVGSIINAVLYYYILISIPYYLGLYHIKTIERWFYSNNKRRARYLMIKKNRWGLTLLTECYSTGSRNERLDYQTSTTLVVRF